MVKKVTTAPKEVKKIFEVGKNGLDEVFILNSINEQIPSDKFGKNKWVKLGKLYRKVLVKMLSPETRYEYLETVLEGTPDMISTFYDDNDTLYYKIVKIDVNKKNGRLTVSSKDHESFDGNVPFLEGINRSFLI